MNTELDMTHTTLPAALFGTAPLVLLGRDERGKPHASRFAPEDGPAARQAAAIMGMATLEAEGDELAGLAAQLPTGKLFDSGRAFVPFVKGALYEQLHDHLPKKEREALAEAMRVKRAAAEAAKAADAEPETFTLPDDWSKIAVGNLVLAYDGEDQAWFEAYIVEAKGTDEFVLRWRGWPDLPNFVRRRMRLALMHPSYRSAPRRDPSHGRVANTVDGNTVGHRAAQRHLPPHPCRREGRHHAGRCHSG